MAEKLFLRILMFTLIVSISINADNKTLTEDKLNVVIEKQDMKFEHFKETTNLILKQELALTQKSLEATNIHIDDVSNRIDNISGSVDRFAMLTTFFGVLITIIVFFFSFKSNSEARQTVEEWLEENGDDFVRKEVQPIKESFEKMILNMQNEMESFKKNSDEEIEKLKSQLEEKGNEAIESLSSKIINQNNFETELSIKDKKYFEYEIKKIKSKPLVERSIYEYTKLIIYQIANKDYDTALELITKLLNKNNYSLENKGMLFYLKALNFYKQGSYENAIVAINEALILHPKLVELYTLKAKIYGFLKKDFVEQRKLLKEALEIDINHYDGYIALSFATIHEAYLSNKLDLYSEAREYSKQAIEINPDLQIAYGTIGFTYLLEAKYKKAKKWYWLLFERNENKWGYYHIFRLYLFLEEPLPKEIEDEYLENYNKKNTENFSLYQMLKIIYNITKKKYINKEEIKKDIEIWDKNYNKQKYYFLELEVLKIWIEQQTDEVQKESLEYALELFDKYRVKA